MPRKRPTRTRTQLEVRHAAALKLVEAGELDGVLALSLVVWPPKGSRLVDENVPRKQQFYSEALKAEIRERHAAGETIPALAQKLGVPFATVKSITGRQAERKREQRARGREAAKPGSPAGALGALVG